ncbi:MAG TPA: serine hydrolase domain-containing protein [Ktedonobacteraceae bacterium]
MSFSDKFALYLQQRAQDHAFSGVALITRGSSQLFTGAYGYASRAWKIPNTLSMRFDTASVTKLFTAVAILQLIEQGHLAFETPVIDFLDLRDTSIAPTVTVYHLLTHTSGIADDADEESGENYAAIWQTRSNYLVQETIDFLPQFAYKPANFPPGQGCRYCNCGYVLLGLLIEKVSGLTYRNYVCQHIFAPAGMLRSDFFRMDLANDEVAEGYDPLRDEQGAIVGWKKNIYAYPPIGSPDGGAHVTAGDLDQFLRQLKAGALLSAPFMQAFFTPQVLHHTTPEWKQMYGYGVRFAVDENGQIIFVEKGGINAGTSAVLRHYPARDINVVLLANIQDGVWEPLKTIHRLLMADEESTA